MTDVLPSALPSASAWSATDLVIMSQDAGATLKKGTGTQLLAFVGSVSPVTGAATVATVAAARALTGLTSPAAVIVEGFWAAGDGGGGIFYYDSSDTTTVEDYSFNLVSASTGRLKRMAPTNEVDIRWFGAVWNDASHPLSGYFASLALAQAQYPEAQSLADEIDGTALQRAINYVLYAANARWTIQSSKYAVVNIPSGRGFCTRGIAVGYGAAGPAGNYTGIIIQGQASDTNTNSQITGTTVYFNGTAACFGFGIQGAYMTTLREMTIIGKYDYLAGKGGFGTNGDLYLNYYQDPAFAGVVSGTARAGTSTTIQLAVGTPGADNYYVGLQIYIVSGTGVGQVRTVAQPTGGVPTPYNSTTKTATVSLAWDVTPDATSGYMTRTEVLFMSTGSCVDPFTTPSAFPPGFIWPALRLPPELQGFNVHDNGHGVFNYGGWAAAGTSNTITLDSSASDIDSYYNTKPISILSGAANFQTRTITSYVGATRVATVSVAWSVVPDTLSFYTIGDPTTDALYNSDGVHLYNVNMARWYVGHGRIGGDSNSEWNSWEGQSSSTSYVILPMMNTGSQSRQPVANGVKFQNFFCAISGEGGLNPNTGNIQSTFKDCHFGYGIKLIDAKAGWAGPVKFDGCYAESIALIGTGQTITLDNTLLSLREQDVFFGVPDFHAVGNLVLQGGSVIATKNGLFVQGNCASYGSDVSIFYRRYSGAVVAATSTTITLAPDTPQATNFYNGMAIYIQTGLGAGQTRTITAYDASTKIATVGVAWTTTPNTTSTYITGQDVSGMALALGAMARGAIFATGDVELHAHNQGEGLCARDHSTYLNFWTPDNFPPTVADASSPHYWSQPYQTSSAAAAYRRTYEQRFTGATAATPPLSFDNSSVPNVYTISNSITVTARTNKDITAARWNPTTGIKADIGDVFAFSATNPDVLTWFICICINGSDMILRQISNYYENFNLPTLYQAVIGSTTAEIVVATYGNCQYSCARVYDFSMYGYVGSISGNSIINLKFGQLGTNTFAWPDRTFPIIAGDTLIITDNTDPWLNVGGDGYAKYWPITSVTQATATMVIGAGTLPATATVIRPKFAIRNFNA